MQARRLHHKRFTVASAVVVRPSRLHRRRQAALALSSHCGPWRLRRTDRHVVCVPKRRSDVERQYHFLVRRFPSNCTVVSQHDTPFLTRASGPAEIRSRGMALRLAKVVSSISEPSASQNVSNAANSTCPLFCSAKPTPDVLSRSSSSERTRSRTIPAPCSFVIPENHAATYIRSASYSTPRIRVCWNLTR